MYYHPSNDRSNHRSNHDGYYDRYYDSYYDQPWLPRLRNRLMLMHDFFIYCPEFCHI